VVEADALAAVSMNTTLRSWFSAIPPGDDPYATQTGHSRFWPGRNEGAYILQLPLSQSHCAQR
jgi:hypothetical protein